MLMKLTFTYWFSIRLIWLDMLLLVILNNSNNITIYNEHLHFLNINLIGKTRFFHDNIEERTESNLLLDLSIHWF